jgi:hypothetical protein
LKKKQNVRTRREINPRTIAAKRMATRRRSMVLTLNVQRPTRLRKATAWQAPNAELIDKRDPERFRKGPLQY